MVSSSPRLASPARLACGSRAARAIHVTRVAASALAPLVAFFACAPASTVPTPAAPAAASAATPIASLSVTPSSAAKDPKPASAASLAASASAAGAATASAAGAASAAASAAPTDPTLVYDSARRYAVVKRFTPAEEAALLKRVYPKFLGSMLECAGAGGDLATMRALGNIVPRVDGALTGSFTKAGAQQTMVNVAVGECGASHAENWGTRETIVFEGDVIVHRAIHAAALQLIDRVDIDGDGIDEVVGHSSYWGGGGGTTSGWMFRIVGKSVKTVVDFDDVGEDACGTGLHHRSEEHVQVRRAPKGGYSVTKKTVNLPCKDP